MNFMKTLSFYTGKRVTNKTANMNKYLQISVGLLVGFAQLGIQKSAFTSILTRKNIDHKNI